MTIKNRDEIAVMRMGGKILSAALSMVAARLAVGVSLKELDEIAERAIRAAGGEPAFLHYRPDGASSPYPASICASVNEYVVHGLPGDYCLKDGDLISIDLGVRFKGLCTDGARTFIVGNGSPAARRLLEITEAALYLGIKEARAGHTLGDIGHIISSYARKNKISVIKGLTGHGIGRELHEEPVVWNVGRPGEGIELVPGMTIAIEPMFSLGGGDIVREDDDSYRTRDHSLSAHFEHTVAITAGPPLILTK